MFFFKKVEFYLGKILQRYVKDKLLPYFIFTKVMILIAVEITGLLYYYILLLYVTLIEW